MSVEFLVTRNVKSPQRNPKENAGIDLFIPEKDSFTEEELKTFGLDVLIEGNNITIPAHKSIIIPAGIKSKFPSNIALIAFNKSGVAIKYQLVCGAQVIDTSYQGEWHINLINTSDSDKVITFGQKITQFVPVVIDDNEIVVHRGISESEFFTETTSRGAGWAGSTGTK